MRMMRKAGFHCVGCRKLRVIRSIWPEVAMAIMESIGLVAKRALAFRSEGLQDVANGVNKTLILRLNNRIHKVP